MAFNFKLRLYEQSMRSIRRLQEIGVGVIAPAAALDATPIANSIAVVAVKDAGKATVPACAARVALTVDGGAWELLPVTSSKHVFITLVYSMNGTS